MIASCLDSNMHKGVTPESYYEKHKRNLIYETGKFGEEYFRKYKGGSPTLQQSMGTGGHNVPMIVGRVGNQQKYEVYEESPTLRGLSRMNNVPMVNEFICDEMKDVANTVTADAYLMEGKRKRVDDKAILTKAHERRLRRLTPVECERLQNFPDNWTRGVSDTQRYKQLGNAVTCSVIEAIGRKMLEVLE